MSHIRPYAQCLYAECNFSECRGEKIHFNKAREHVVATARQTDKAGELIR